MKVNFVKAYLLNPAEEKVMVKIPRAYESLREFIVEPYFKFNVDDTIEKSFDAENFGEFLYSVTDVEIRNFTIEEPTNIFYLNAYFMILKERKLHVPEEELVITTEKLKRMIAELLNIENKDLNLQRIHDVIQGNESKQKKVMEQKELERKKREEDAVRLPKGATLADVDSVVSYYTEEGKPIFSIKKLQRIQREINQRNRN